MFLCSMSGAFHNIHKAVQVAGILDACIDHFFSYGQTAGICYD